MEEYKILGIKVNTISQPALKATLLAWLEGNEQHQIATVNSEFIVRAQTDPEFKNIINNSSLSTIDGSGPIFALKFNRQKVNLDQRLTGVQLTEILIALALTKDYKILFCLNPRGLTRPEKFSLQIKNKYPTLEFQVADSAEAVTKGQAFQPEIILANLGAPQQEFWINENLPKIPSAKIAMGVGGTFDFISGQMKRAPKFLRSFGLEWLWRLIQQPKRIVRILRAVVVFPALVFKNRLLKNI